MAVFLTILGITTFSGLVQSIPPPQCFANFNWNDCGKPPQPVIYYWKTGSRCEVGIWRGCRPNMNMFKDEYECVSTCIFTIRAGAEDWHKLNAFDEDMTENMTDYDAIINGTDFGNGTSEFDNSTSVNSTAPDANETVTEGGDATDGATGDDAGGDVTAGDGTTVEGTADGASPGDDTTQAEGGGEAEATTEAEPDA